MTGCAIVCRVSMGNRGLSCLQYLRAAVHDSIPWKVEFFCRSGCRNARAARVPDLWEKAVVGWILEGKRSC
jgi:hypothetical protein